MEKKKKIGLSAKMLIGMALGLIVGIVVGPSISWIKPFGTIFVNLLKMCMVPVIFVSITLSIAQVTDLKAFGRIGIKIFVFYCITSALAAVNGICWATIIRPGVGFSAATAGAVEKEIPDIVSTLVNIIPTNIIQALANANLMSIIFFAIMFGIAISLIGEKNKPVIEVLDSLNAAILKMINICLQYAPIGVFALMANMAGANGLDVILPLGKFLITEYAAMLTQILVVYGVLLAIMGKINIFKFINRVKSVLIMAFSTTSSSATVPLELELCESHMGVPRSIGGFSFPLGSTVNQDGAGLNIPICLLFTAQIYGMKFTFAELIMIVFLCLIMSIGAAGIPAGASIFILMILGQFGLPSDAFGLILASYVLIDVGLTTVNICGDMVCTTSVCRTEGVLNTKVWEPGYDAEAAHAAAKSAE
ncbi:dicarboxylate/amino acid:cation symporter [Dysosmobacter sp.]|uniref:dicarboxylate/amino acid:cation symporter n=1 Tax=Dysosmobacter sp. TaxID=2591382 RepID=UPI002A8A4865|nr:dicarboxylate/amino acid:cation symporter [Dysosmobacter sp.]MDY3280921.1 dicarboxylate/amino acid:cation symporter [Dysosmobacter sp.]